MDRVFGNRTDVVICEDRYFPLLVQTTFGSTSILTATEYFRWFEEQANRAVRDRVSVALLADASCADVPDVDARRAIADLASELDRRIPTAIDWRTVVVIDNRSVRAVLQTLSWLHGDFGVEIVGTREDALERVSQHLVRQGIAVPAAVTSALLRRPELAAQNQDVDGRRSYLRPRQRET